MDDPLLTGTFPAVRISEEQHKLLNSLDVIYGLNRSELLRDLLAAWTECALREGKTNFPLKVQVDRQKLRAIEAARMSKVEEMQAKYRIKSPPAKKPQPRPEDQSGAA